MASQQNLVLIVEDLWEFSMHLRQGLVQVWQPRTLEVKTCTHKAAFTFSDDQWLELLNDGLRAVFVDAHDLSRERAWSRGAEDLPFPLAGADVGKRILALPEPPRLIMYSGEMTNPMINVALRQATQYGANGYYDADALLDPGTLRSAIADSVPRGQFPPPSGEDLATYAGAWHAAHEAHQRPGSGVFNLLVGGEEAIKSLRALPTTARNTTQKALRRLAGRSGFADLKYRPWDDIARRMQEIVGVDKPTKRKGTDSGDLPPGSGNRSDGDIAPNEHSNVVVTSSNGQDLSGRKGGTGDGAGVA